MPTTEPTTDSSPLVLIAEGMAAEQLASLAADPVIRLAAELMARPSVTPDDQGCQELLATRLAAIGFDIERMPFAGVDNLWARRGTSEPLFVFAGHTDVVPTGPAAAWRFPPFQPTLADGELWGRGAADMKGSLAAMVVALEAFIAAHPEHPGSIALLITSDEEGPAEHGTREVMATLLARDEQITWCVVGEPSSRNRSGDMVRNGRRGSLNGRLTVRGVQGHVAYPETVLNPIHAAAPALAELASTRWDDGNSWFPATSFQVSNISSGTGATNVVPGSLDALFNFRYATASTAEALKQRTAGILDSHDLDWQVDWTLSGEPFLTGDGELLAATSQVVERELGTVPEFSTGGGTSDGRFIAPAGVQLVELGPPNATIHQVDERVPARELQRLVPLYRGLLTELFDVHQR